MSKVHKSGLFTGDDRSRLSHGQSMDDTASGAEAVPRSFEHVFSDRGRPQADSM